MMQEGVYVYDRMNQGGNTQTVAPLDPNPIEVLKKLYLFPIKDHSFTCIRLLMLLPELDLVIVCYSI